MKNLLRMRQFQSIALSLVFHVSVAAGLYAVVLFNSSLIAPAESDLDRTQVHIVHEPVDDTSGVIAIEEEVFEEPLQITSQALEPVLSPSVTPTPALDKEAPISKRDPFRPPTVRKPLKIAQVPDKPRKSNKQGKTKEFSVTQDLTQRNMRTRVQNQGCEVLQQPLPSVRKGVEGEVKVRFIVENNGRVSKIKAKSFPKNLALSRAVREAVSKWKFRPGQKCRISQNFVFK